MSKIRSLLINFVSIILSVLTDKRVVIDNEVTLSGTLDSANGHAHQAADSDKQVFGKNNIPELSYSRMIELLNSHYIYEQRKTGQIGRETAKQLSSMNFEQIKALFDAIMKVKISHKDYIDDESEDDKDPSSS